MDLSLLFWSGIVAAALAIGFAFVQHRKVLGNSEGTDKMKEIASAIREGANAYLKRQYRLVILFFSVMTAVLAALAYIPLAFGAPGLVNEFIPFAFLTGGFFTGLAGFIGMKAATQANARTAFAAQQGLNRGLRVAFSSGTVMGFIVAGFGLLDIAAWYLILHYVFERGPEVIAPVMLTFGMGVASMSMFARVGGGIFTKAADVGADLVGKVEVGIPEDDPRNPAVIADNVGDNVGDVAGMGADLYESYANALVATFAIGVAAGYGSSGLLLPMLIASVGIVASIIGTFCVQTKEKATQESLLRSLHRGTYIAGAISAVTALPLVLWVSYSTGDAMWRGGWGAAGIYGSVLIGLIAGFIIAHSTEVFTSVSHKPTKELAGSSETGTAMIMIGGISLGMKSAAIPVLTVGISIIISYIISGGLLPNNPDTGFVAFNAGLYGIGLAAVGMLATLSVTLAADAYGPVADNAGGIAQMAGLPDEVRERTDALDSLGNTTAAIGKGFAIGSTAFTAVALLVSYVNIANDQLIGAAIRRLGAAYEGMADVVTRTVLLQHENLFPLLRDGGFVNEEGWALNLQLTNPPMLVGLFFGAVMCFIFAALTIGAVGNAAQSIVREVRRQFKEIVGLMEGKAKPDYAACVDICTRSAQKEMLRPALLVILAPVVLGSLLGPEGVIGLLTGVIVTGFPMAVFMLSAGGAWDNAKKYIEKGRFGGKGSDSHKAAVIGDTVGDPLKDTTGPSYNLLITLSSTVAIVFVGVVIAISQMMPW